MGPVRRNHCQIRRAKTGPADGYSTVIGQLEIASTQSAQELERQPPNAKSTGETMPSTPKIESEDTLPATIECGLRRSQHERRRPSRFRDYVVLKTLFLSDSFQRLGQVETVLIKLVFFVFFVCPFFKRGRVLHNYVSHASLHQHVITILSHRPLYTLHFVAERHAYAKRARGRSPIA